MIGLQYFLGSAPHLPKDPTPAVRPSTIRSSKSGPGDEVVPAEDGCFVMFLWVCALPKITTKTEQGRTPNFKSKKKNDVSHKYLYFKKHMILGGPFERIDLPSKRSCTKLMHKTSVVGQHHEFNRLVWGGNMLRNFPVRNEGFLIPPAWVDENLPLAWRFWDKDSWLKNQHPINMDISSH